MFGGYGLYISEAGLAGGGWECGLESASEEYGGGASDIGYGGVENEFSCGLEGVWPPE